MRSRTAVALALVLVVGGGVAAWALVLRGDNVAPLALPSTNPSAATSPPPDGSADPSSAAPSPATASGSAIDAAAIPGTWTIGADSVVGYRVRERQIAGSLAFPFSDFGINPPNVGGFVTVEDNGHTQIPDQPHEGLSLRWRD